MGALLTRDEEVDLITKAQNGDKNAMDKLIESNMGLCRRWAGKAPRPTWMDVEDLVQEGVFGLRRAIKGFDVTKGFAFSTYAVHWIRQTIQRKVEGSYYALYTPAHMFTRIGRIEKSRKRLRNELVREPTIEEVTEDTGFTRNQILEADELSMATVSLNEGFGEDGDAFLGDMIPDETDYASIAENRAWVAELVSLLPEGLQEILILRYGLNGQTEMTLADIARMKNLSRERIRQLQNKALRLIRQKLADREKQEV